MTLGKTRFKIVQRGVTMKSISTVVLVGMPKCFKTIICNSIRDKHTISIVDPSEGFRNHIHLNNLEYYLDRVYNKYREDSIIVVEESSDKLFEINKVCSRYPNCNVVFTFNNPNKVTEQGVESIINILNIYSETVEY